MSGRFLGIIFTKQFCVKKYESKGEILIMQNDGAGFVARNTRAISPISLVWFWPCKTQKSQQNTSHVLGDEVKVKGHFFKIYISLLVFTVLVSLSQ